VREQPQTVAFEAPDSASAGKPNVHGSPARFVRTQKLSRAIRTRWFGGNIAVLPGAFRSIRPDPRVARGMPQHGKRIKS
jgi:hypothetical protein